MSPTFSKQLFAGALSIALSPLTFSMSEAPVEPVLPPESLILQEAEAANVAVNNDVLSEQNNHIPDSGHFSVWQGLDHEWKRFIIDQRNGRIPHRISEFSNSLINGANNNVTFTMAQNTGVDGNYMYPVSHAALIQTDALDLQQGEIRLRWTDMVDGSDSEIPQAKSHISKTISLPDLNWNEGSSTVVMQGYELVTECNQDRPNSECNSDGIWPYIFHLSIDDCRAAEIRGSECDVNVHIHRAWTPNKGGFELIGEIKPINLSTHFDLTVHYAGLSTAAGSIAVGSELMVQAEKELQDYDNLLVPVEIKRHSQHFSNAFLAVKGIGFALTEPDSLSAGWSLYGSDLRQRGRYIAQQKFQLINGGYSGDYYNASVEMGVWSPTTVVDSNVVTEMQLQLIELNGSVQTLNADGKLCINSKPEAPFFSKWEKCNRTTATAIEKFGGKEADRISIDKQL